METAYPQILRVSQINYYLKEYLAEDDFLSSLAVQGEVSGLKFHQSGHVYFTLREGVHNLKAVMFRRYAAQMKWKPRDGEQVIALGSIALYERDGVCQLYVEELVPAGAGEQAKNLEERKRRLEEEGLFAPERKQPLPKLAERVGVITAAGSAAWADIQRIIHRRFPLARLVLYPALVQGDQAPESIAAALQQADQGGHQVLICGRGGGANEDLDAFNQEIVVRAIAGVKTPLISAVGHESDFTLADLAADVRAATPTHAATLAVPDQQELLQRLDNLAEQMQMQAEAQLTAARQRWQHLAEHPLFVHPELLLRTPWQILDQAEKELLRAGEIGIRSRGQKLAAAAARLELLSPLSVLARGYAIVSRADGSILRDVGQVQPGDALTIRPGKGRLCATVTEIQEET